MYEDMQECESSISDHDENGDAVIEVFTILESAKKEMDLHPECKNARAIICFTHFAAMSDPKKWIDVFRKFKSENKNIQQVFQDHEGGGGESYTPLIRSPSRDAFNANVSSPTLRQNSGGPRRQLVTPPARLLHEPSPPRFLGIPSLLEVAKVHRSSVPDLFYEMKGVTPRSDSVCEMRRHRSFRNELRKTSMGKLFLGKDCKVIDDPFSSETLDETFDYKGRDVKVKLPIGWEKLTADAEGMCMYEFFTFKTGISLVHCLTFENEEITWKHYKVNHIRDSVYKFNLVPVELVKDVINSVYADIVASYRQ